MGGKGTFAHGKSVKYTYKTIDKNPQKSPEKPANIEFELTANHSSSNKLSNWRHCKPLDHNHQDGVWRDMQGLKVKSAAGMTGSRDSDFSFNGSTDDLIAPVRMDECKEGIKVPVMHTCNKVLKKIKPCAMVCPGKPFTAIIGNSISVGYVQSERVSLEMGGRGTFAHGNPVKYKYRTIDKIDGYKVLEGIDGKHNLPEESHSSRVYMRYYPGTKNIREIRIYDENGRLTDEIAYHGEASINNGDRHTPILHHHTYDKNNVRELVSFSENDPLLKEFRKYFPKNIKIYIDGKIQRR